MGLFLAICFSFPVVVFSGLMILATIYWLIASLGLLDIGVLDLDSGAEPSLDIGDADVSGGESGPLTGMLFKLGLHGVPTTLIITLITVFGWLISYFGVYFFLWHLGAGWLKFILSLLLLLAAFMVAIGLTAVSLRPVRALFKNNPGAINAGSLRGTVVIIRSAQVTTSLGEATRGGGDLLLQVRAVNDQTRLTKGHRAVILDYNEESHTYTVIEEREFKGY